MNKQEAIEKIEKEKSNLNAWEDLTRNRALDDALAIVRKLDEPVKPPEPKPWQPEKPVIPQYVADYIDSEQNSWSTLSEALDNMDDEKRILDWFYVNSETFAKAWLYGYEVEKEKLYTVKFSNEDFGKTYIGIIKTANKIGISTVPINDECSKCYFTKSELEEFKFWNNPAFEIKEVTE